MIVDQYFSLCFHFLDQIQVEKFFGYGCVRGSDYNIIRGTTSRVGIIKITNSNGVAFFEDEYAETASTGVNLNFANIGGSAILQYTTSNTTQDASFNYYIKSFT